MQGFGGVDHLPGQVVHTDEAVGFDDEVEVVAAVTFPGLVEDEDRAVIERLMIPLFGSGFALVHQPIVP